MLKYFDNIATPIVPILLAASPFSATLSQPVIAISIKPLDIIKAAILSHIKVTSILDSNNSKLVNLAPCKRGRVSSAYTPYSPIFLQIFSSSECIFLASFSRILYKSKEESIFRDSILFTILFKA